MAFHDDAEDVATAPAPTYHLAAAGASPVAVAAAGRPVQIAEALASTHRIVAPTPPPPVTTEAAESAPVQEDRSATPETVGEGAVS